MTKTLTKAIESTEAQALLSQGLKVISTDRQLENGTIVLAGKVKKQPVHYKITATGAVLSNRFVARQVFAESQLKQYRAGLRAAGELFSKRFA